jgi:hypothetical protein
VSRCVDVGERHAVQSGRGQQRWQPAVLALPAALCVSS